MINGEEGLKLLSRSGDLLANQLAATDIYADLPRVTLLVPGAVATVIRRGAEIAGITEDMFVARTITLAMEKVSCTLEQVHELADDIAIREAHASDSH